MYWRRTARALIVMPFSRSRSIESRTWLVIWRPSTVWVSSSSRSASVDLPWSMCAMIEKFRRRSWGIATRAQSSPTRPRPVRTRRPAPPTSPHPTSGRVRSPPARARPRWSPACPSYCSRSSGGHSPPARSSIAAAMPLSVAARSSSPFAAVTAASPLMIHGIAIASPRAWTIRSASRDRASARSRLPSWRSTMLRFDDSTQTMNSSPFSRASSSRLVMTSRAPSRSPAIWRATPRTWRALERPSEAGVPSVAASASRHRRAASAGSRPRATRAAPARASATRFESPTSSARARASANRSSARS